MTRDESRPAFRARVGVGGPSPWLVLVPALVLVLLGVRAVLAEMSASDDRARNRARAAAAGVVRAVDVLAREFAEGLPAAGTELSEEEALAAARHLFPRHLVSAGGGALIAPASGIAAPTVEERDFVTDALAAAERIGFDPAGREAASAFLRTAAATAATEPPRDPLWLVADMLDARGVLDPSAGGVVMIPIPPSLPERYEWVATDAHGWGEPMRSAVLDAIDHTFDAVPDLLRAIRSRADAVRAAAAEAAASGAPSVWMAATADDVAIGVVSPRIGVGAGAGGTTLPAHIAGEVPATVVRERIARQIEQTARDAHVSVTLVSPDGAAALARRSDAAHVRPVVESAALEPPFDAWHVEVVASSEGGVPGTVFALAIAVIVTATGLVWGVFALRRAADAQARLAAERQTFLDHVAHEVRTPAGALLALSEELAAGHIPAARQPKYHAHLAEESRRLARLVEDTLDLSRIDAGRLVLDRADADLREIVADGLRSAGAADRVVLRAPAEPVVVRADAAALRRVVRNLVDNALRHGAAEPKPEVSVSIDDTHARVAVRDHGKGIAPDHLPRVFDRFWRAPSETHETKGVGIGLAICLEIARAHGGDVVVASEPGAGATFTLVLPLAAAPRERTRGADR